MELISILQGLWEIFGCFRWFLKHKSFFPCFLPTWIRQKSWYHLISVINCGRRTNNNHEEPKKSQRSMSRRNNTGILWKFIVFWKKKINNFHNQCARFSPITEEVSMERFSASCTVCGFMLVNLGNNFFLSVFRQPNCAEFRFNFTRLLLLPANTCVCSSVVAESNTCM